MTGSTPLSTDPTAEQEEREPARPGIAPASSAPLNPPCHFCGGAVSTATGYRRVIGWERRRRKGGTNQIVLRETIDEWACPSCIDLARAGRLRQQEIPA